MSGILIGRGPMPGLDVQNPPAPQGVLAAPPPPQGVMPQQQPADYPNAAQIQALMITPEQAFQAYQQAHPVRSRLEMFGAALQGGAPMAEAERQTLAARQMQPLALAQQKAAFQGAMQFYSQFSGDPEMQALILTSPETALKIIAARETPQTVPGGQTTQIQGNAPSVTAPLVTAPAPGPMASVTTPQGFSPLGVAPVLGNPGQHFIAPPPIGAQTIGNQPPTGDAGAYGLPTGLTAGDKILSPEDAHKSDPGLAAGFGLIVRQDGTKTPVPPNITEDQFNTQGQAYLSATPHLEAQSRAQALSGLATVLSNLPAGPIQAQTALNAYMGALNPHANQTRPSSMEDFINRQSLPEDVSEQVSKMFGPGATLTPQNVKLLYRAVDQLTRPVVAADGALLAPLQATASKYNYDASTFAKNQAKMPDVPAFARDALPPANQRHIGQVAWGAKGPAQWNGKAWTLISGPQ